MRTRVLRPVSPTEVAWLGDAWVAWEAGRLTHVTEWSGQSYDLDARDAVLTPGFVDAHIHAAQTRIVGSASGPLLQWLDQSTFPEESRFADPDHAERVARDFATALAAAGTTLSFVYGSVHAEAADALFRALDTRGLRAIAGPVWMNRGAPRALLRDTERTLDDMTRLHETWHGHDGRLSLAVIPRFGLSCTHEMMAAAGTFARERGLWVSTHLSENLDECRATTAVFGTEDYLEIYEDAGLLTDHSVYAHCIHLSTDAWRRFHDAGATVAHCPDSNDFLGSGGMPVHEVLDRQIPMALGTDVAAGRTFRVPRVASSAHDNALRKGRRVPPASWFWHATRGGALALKHPHIGDLRPGLEADMVLHELPAWVDDADGALSWLLFHHDAPPPRGTWVRGRQVWDRKHHDGGFPWHGAHA
jgi:guanine deaminase